MLIIGDNPYYQKVFSSNLRNHFQLIFAKHRGFVAPVESVDNSAYELGVIIDDIEGMRVKLDIEKLIILGHSGNAYIALEYAKAYPKNTSGVVMVGIAPDLSASSKEYANKNWEAIACEKRTAALALSLQKTPDTALEGLAPSDAFIVDYARKTPQIWYDYNFDPLPLFADSYFNVDMISYVWGEIFSDIDITANTNNFNVPIWVALGKYDGLVSPLSSWEKVLDSFSNMDITVYNKSGHTPQYEEPAKFDADLIKWVETKVK